MFYGILIFRWFQFLDQFKRHIGKYIHYICSLIASTLGGSVHFRPLLERKLLWEVSESWSCLQLSCFGYTECEVLVRHQFV